MKKQLITVLLASVIMNNAGVVNAATERKELPKATPKAEVALSNFKTFKDHIIERLEEFEAEQEAERLRLEQEKNKKLLDYYWHKEITLKNDSDGKQFACGDFSLQYFKLK